MTAAPNSIGPVIDALRAGEVVVVPTDTVYGIAALPTIEGATAGLFAAKGRAADVPVAVLCHDADQALALAESVSPAAADLAARHWPGPLTLVLARRAGLGWALGEPAATIGLRCPDHDLIRAITAEVGPIAVTSANRHGVPTPPTAADAAEQLVLAPAVVVDGGVLDNPPSTVVDATGADLRVLRQGPVTL